MTLSPFEICYDLFRHIPESLRNLGLGLTEKWADQFCLFPMPQVKARNLNPALGGKAHILGFWKGLEVLFEVQRPKVLQVVSAPHGVQEAAWDKGIRQEGTHDDSRGLFGRAQDDA